MNAFSEKMIDKFMDILVEILVKHCTKEQMEAIMEDLALSVETSEFIEESKRRN